MDLTVCDEKVADAQLGVQQAFGGSFGQLQAVQSELHAFAGAKQRVSDALRKAQEALNEASVRDATVAAKIAELERREKELRLKSLAEQQRPQQVVTSSPLCCCRRSKRWQKATRWTTPSFRCRWLH